jgi:two-component system response regulator YesN
MKIVVVEDEIRTRRGVVGLIQKLSPEYEVIGEAENGLLGYELITKLSPDLAIVDVKMPKMDGIEMIQNLRETGINCRAVILSGYSEFEYAQKAIKMGVSEYLLKPITVEDLENTLKNVKKEIEAERLEQKQSSLTSIEQIFQNLVLGDIGKEEKYIEYLNEKYELSPDSEYIAVVGYLGNGFKSSKDAVRGIVTPLIEKLTDLKYYIIDLNPQNELLILMVSPENPRELEKYFQDQILKAICNSGIRDMVLGWIQFDGLKNLKSSLQILKKELKWSIVLGEDILLTYPKTQKIFTRLLQYPIDIEKNVKAAVYSNDIDKLIKNVEDFLELMHREIYKPDQIIEVFVRFASSIINVIKEVNAELYDQLNQKEILQKIKILLPGMK